MGVSVSAAFAILVSAAVVSLSVFIAVVDSAVTRVIDASTAADDSTFDRDHTSIRIDNATYSRISLTLYIRATNTGSTSLDAGLLQVIVNGGLLTRMVDANQTRVDGTHSRVWAPETVLTLELPQLWYPPGSDPDAPQRIKVVTANAVSDYTTDIYIPPPP